MLEDILLKVHKPAQYIGREWNVSKKNFARAEIKFALCFPDLYEIGMSNLGIRILYGVLNKIPDVTCERFFSPDKDMEDTLRCNDLEPVSLESGNKLKDFDIIGFSLASELNYTNVLNIMDLGNIPFESLRRDNTHPLVIAGGPCTMNPEPMHEFFDLFIIGEAEEVVIEFIDIYRKYREKFKTGKITKDDLLYEFAQIEGVYIPSFYQVFYKSNGEIESFRPKDNRITAKVKKRFIENLNLVPFPTEWLLPYIQIVHDRITLEVMRGCPNRCRFCQARSQYFPLRIREQSSIVDLAVASYKSSGYEEMSLIGLSVSDYPDIQALLKQLIALFKEKGVGVSLPSIKAKALVGSLFSLIATIKKTGLTFAPEAGSERLRKILAKDFNENELLSVMQEAYSAGYQHAKLYFMIGLPFEENEDLDGIIDLSRRVSELKRKMGRGSAQVNISVNAFIPKSHTPLQWFKMNGVEAIKYKQNYLRDKIKGSKLKFNFHNPNMSFLEGVFSRGDRRLSSVVLSAFRAGARFDAWGNYFDFEKWIHAFRQANIEPQFYLRQIATDEILPWEFLDVGASRDYLCSEYNKVIAIE